MKQTLILISPLLLLIIIILMGAYNYEKEKDYRKAQYLECYKKIDDSQHCTTLIYGG